MIEFYLTYEKDAQFCAVKEDDLNADTATKGFHFQLQWSTRAEDMWIRGGYYMFNFKNKKVQTETKEIEDDDYGGFIISKNVWNGVKIGYSYRERSTKAELNGWTIYSVQDDDAYVNDFKNFIIINATSMHQVDSLMLKIFDAPYGTDLCWQYNQKGDFIGFYDLVNQKNVTIKEILKHK